MSERAIAKVGGYDAVIAGDGSIYRLICLTDSAYEWVIENVEAEYPMLSGRTLAIEWRFVDSILAGMMAEGLTIARMD